MIRRMDLDSDQKISKQEFFDAIEPQEPFSKMVVRARIAERKGSRSASKERKLVALIRSGSRSNSQIKLKKNTSAVKIFQ